MRCSATRPWSRRSSSQILAERAAGTTLKRKKKNWGDFVIIDKINEKLLDLTNAITKAEQGLQSPENNGRNPRA